MGLRILYFAWVRERIGLGEEEFVPPADVRTVADMIAWLAATTDAHASALGEPDKLRAALDQAFVPLDAPIAGARELAIFPPVTGG